MRTGACLDREVLISRGLQVQKLATRIQISGARHGFAAMLRMQKQPVGNVAALEPPGGDHASVEFNQLDRHTGPRNLMILARLLEIYPSGKMSETLCIPGERKRAPIANIRPAENDKERMPAVSSSMIVVGYLQCGLKQGPGPEPLDPHRQMSPRALITAQGSTAHCTLHSPIYMSFSTKSKSDS